MFRTTEIVVGPPLLDIVHTLYRVTVLRLFSSYKTVEIRTLSFRNAVIYYYQLREPRHFASF